MQLKWIRNGSLVLAGIADGLERDACGRERVLEAVEIAVPDPAVLVSRHQEDRWQVPAPRRLGQVSEQRFRHADARLRLLSEHAAP